MSVLAELLGGIAELFTPAATVSSAHRSTRAAVLIDGVPEELVERIRKVLAPA